MGHFRSPPRESRSHNTPRVPVIDAINAGPEITLLDVRDTSEWNAGHAPGARHVPLADLPRRLEQIPKDRPVYVICHSGDRSSQATEALLQHGYHAAVVDGGMSAWQSNGGRVLNRSNRPGRIT